MSHTSGLTALEPLTSAEILERAAGLPAVQHYPSVDELHEAFAALAAQHPEQMSVTRLGHSRAGEPILLYSITGEDDEEARVLSGLLAGGVHPNEPIGSWTMLHLAEQLLTEERLRRSLASSWHFLPCADPDSMRLNEGWFHAPEDRELYFQNFYRPAGPEQVEWTFPFRYKAAHFDAMLPETHALQRAIDLTRPDFYLPLHNAESGGAYYYLSDTLCAAPGSRVEPLHELLSELPAAMGVPLHRGEPEAAHFEILSPGIFAMGSLEEAYDWVEALGLDPFPEGSTGESSTGYASRCGTLSMVAEMPQWKHRLADDISPGGASYASALRDQAAALSASGVLLMGVLGRLGTSAAPEPPLLRASRAFLPLLGQAAQSQRARAEDPAAQREATVAELHGLQGILHMLRLRFGGMFLRALEELGQAGSPGAASLAEELSPVYENWMSEAAEQEQDLEPIPIKDAAGLQYGAVLALAAHTLRVRQGG
ncbi:peptidase M14 [Nesterenkonia sp. E16_7]|uniref:M14 family zinc carboxypeptidase n=1 Tax=unclassified Nesterenkonia TaxID=2629769 RepID=UPI001A931894|nr:peptidase M14 [Nesterenkonia sp. E16_10]MBO0598117.1 peptidase M14 [Nesterenkonia sp. E16_7]